LPIHPISIPSLAEPHGGLRPGVEIHENGDLVFSSVVGEGLRESGAYLPPPSSPFPFPFPKYMQKPYFIYCINFLLTSTILKSVEILLNSRAGDGYLRVSKKGY
jgi:hypothetical protein